MKTIKYFFFLIFVFFTLLGILAVAILFLRPDLNYDDFLHDWKFWIVPAVLIYVVFNFKKLLSSIFNRVLIFGMFIWSGYYFFPGLMNTIKPYVSNSVSTTSAKNTINELITPKDGTKPIVQIDSSGIKYKPENRDVKIETNNIATKSNSTPPDKLKLDSTKNPSSLSNEQISHLSSQPLEYISKITSLAPPEIKDRLSSIGINMDNPQQTISNLVGNDSKKQRQAINQIFK